jgi:ATP-dependent Zn protease
MTLGAMAAEHVFYGENSQGVSGDLYSATATAAAMVGMWGMGPDELPISIRPDRRLKPGEQPDPQRLARERLEEIGDQIMNRASSGSFSADAIGNTLSSPGKRRAVAQLLGQAYVTAYALMATNKDALNRIADTLVERKEMHGDEVVDLLNSVGLVRPVIDVGDDSTWPTV